VGARAAALPLWVGAATPLSDRLPSLAARPLRRLAPPSLRVPPAAGRLCLPRARPLAAPPARRHRHLCMRSQPGCAMTTPPARLPACARRAWWQPRHGRGRSSPRHGRDSSGVPPPSGGALARGGATTPT